MHTVIRRGGQLVAALALVVTMSAATTSSCASQPPVSDRPPQDQQVDPGLARVAVITVTEATGPADVWMRAHEVGHALGDHTRETIPGPGYTQRVVYTSGKKIVIWLSVTGHPGDIFACQITDGPLHKVRERRAGQAVCQLTTGQ